MIRRISCLLVWVLVVVGCWAAGPDPVGAGVPGAASPSTAPDLWCTSSQTVDMVQGDVAVSDSGYVRVWVPAGAKLTGELTGQIMPSRYVGNGRGEYTMNFEFIDPSSNVVIDSYWNFLGMGISWGGGPYDWVPVGPKSAPNMWTNSGVNRPGFVGGS